MRLALVASVLAALAGTARSDYVEAPLVAPDPDRGNFWRDLITPHKDEIDMILAKARLGINTAEMALYSDYDPTGMERTRFHREIYGMLRYARRLAPDDLDVLRYLAQTADEHGKTREALDALHTAVDLVGPEKAGVDITGRLGIIYLRLGKLDTAIRYLRAAQSPVIAGTPMTAHVLLHLAHALAARGQMTEAIDVLANSAPAQQVPYYINELVLVNFALAVQYDRDEQRGAAFEILDRMHGIMSGTMTTTVQQLLGGVRFAPAADRHYYFGLLYETAGHYAEARAEWALYAAAGDLPYRRRALDHIAAIDAMQRAPRWQPGQRSAVPHRISPRRPRP